VLDYQKDNVLRSSQRDFADRSLKTSPTTFPGQYNQGGNVQNPSFPTCGAPHGIPNSAGGTDATCGYLYAKEVDMIPRDERISGQISGTLKLGSESRLNLEYFYSQNKVQTLIAGVPYGALIINPGTAFYPGNGITPLPTAFTLNPAYMPANPPAGALPGFVKLRMRDELSGGRQEGTNNKQQRLVASLDGVVGGWDYNVGAAYNENKLTDSLIGGYTDGTKIYTDVRDGIINPFGDQTPAGLQALSDAAAKGVLFTAKGQVYTLDG
jgi:iron complex outermembrane receptor protein